jgi:tetratricopeptide (TPR) repeat protein
MEPNPVSKDDMRASMAIASAVAVCVAGCGSTPITAVPVDASGRLAAANALIAEGCFDCLTEALGQFEQIAHVPNLTPAASTAAAAGVVRSATLLNLRERELGMLDEGELRKVRETLASHQDIAGALAETVDILASVAWRIPEASGMSDDERFRAARAARDTRDVWTAALKAHAGEDAFAAYAWLAFACSSETPRSRPEEVRALYAPIEPQAGTALVQFKRAICPTVATPGLAALLERDPRFIEINYYLSLDLRRAGKTDEADEYLAKAYAWHPRWPAVTLARAGLAMSAEDFDRALAFYDETLSLVPGQRDAMLGRVQSLSYLGRHEEAIAAADDVLEGDWYRGEAYYWRAWNETQLEREDAAWADVDQAWKVYINGDVAKLYGLLALHRRDLDKAQAMFEEGRRLKPDDCENPYYLGLVHAERRHWPTTADLFSTASTCFDVSRVALRADISRLAGAEMSAARKARLIATRERQFAIEGRMLATSWFNVAVASFNLSRMDTARQFAEKVVGDEQYDERAREILSRLEK